MIPLRKPTRITRKRLIMNCDDIIRISNIYIYIFIELQTSVCDSIDTSVVLVGYESEWWA